jgi:hypothetical protein
MTLMAARQLSLRAGLRGEKRALDERLAECLQLLAWMLPLCPPRSISVFSDTACWIVYTDGSAEGTERTAAVGGVLVPPGGGQCEYFAEHIPGEVVERWMSMGSRQIIGQAELLPVLMAKHLWSSKLRMKRVVFYIDNDAARYSLVSMYSPAAFSCEILQGVLVADLACMALCWYARVPSAGNLADGPSRVSFDDMNTINAVRVRATIPELKPWTAEAVRQALRKRMVGRWVWLERGLRANPAYQFI